MIGFEDDKEGQPECLEIRNPSSPLLNPVTNVKSNDKLLCKTMGLEKPMIVPGLILLFVMILKRGSDTEA